MTFDTLPAAMRKVIRRKVEAELEKYRLYKYLAFEEREARITPNYEPRYHGPTNQTSDQTGDIAAHNVDELAKRRAFCERIERAVDRLPEKERFLIRARYMVNDAQYVTDYSVYQFSFDPPISENTYAKLRDRAMLKLAFQFGMIDEGGRTHDEDTQQTSRHAGR